MTKVKISRSIEVCRIVCEDILWRLSGQCVRRNNYDIMYRWGMTSSMHSAFIRSKEGSSVITKEEQRRKVQRHPSLL